MWAHQGLENVTRVILSYVSVVQTACKEKVDIQRYSWSIFEWKCGHTNEDFFSGIPFSNLTMTEPVIALYWS